MKYSNMLVNLNLTESSQENSKDDKKNVQVIKVNNKNIKDFKLGK